MTPAPASSFPGARSPSRKTSTGKRRSSFAPCWRAWGPWRKCGTAPPTPRPAVAPAPVTAPGSGLDGVTVEPPGADVLRPGERNPEVHREIATGHLSLDSPGADILKPHERKKPVEVHLDLSRLRVEPADDA